MINSSTHLLNESMCTITIKEPPFFDLEDDPIDWLQKYKATAKVNGWTNDYSLSIAPRMMHEHYQSSFQESYTTWEAFEEAFRNYFQTDGYMFMAFQQAVAYRQDETESVRSLVDKLCTWFRRGDITDEKLKIQIFIGAMNDATYNAIDSPFSMTYDELVQTLLQRDEVNSPLSARPILSQHQGWSASHRQVPTAFANNQQDGLLDTVIDLMGQLSPNQVQAVMDHFGRWPNDGQGQPRMSRRRQLTCYRCQTPGHVARNCTELVDMSSSSFCG
ncbi:hypothetical protein BGX34_001429 [Mortierella sp. NVP85]|nr:hypothetical protein BGX34_001429 [Mortierella sp. NVP85]